MTSKQKGILALAMAAVLSGFFGVYSHYVSVDFPPVYQSAVRNVIQLIILAGLFLLPIGRRKPVIKSDWKWFLLRSMCGMVNAILLYIAFTKISIGTTYFLSFAAATICGYILGSSLFKERIGRQGLVALGLSIIGMSLVYSVSFEASTVWYSLAALVSGIVAPGWSVFSKAISKSYSNIQTNLVDTIFAAVASVALSLALHEKWTRPEWDSTWAAVFGFAIISLVIMILIVYGFKRVDAQVGTLLLLLEIVAGIVLGYAFYRQTMPVGSVIGGTMILAAIHIRIRGEHKPTAVHHRHRR
jgi:drug/metabolite transporter (DMT)-like permease